MSKFRRGTIAMNDAGQLGYIQTVYGMVMGGVQCGGFRLDVEHGGDKWQAINPKFVCHVDDLTKRFDGDTFVIPRRDDDPAHDCSGGAIGPATFEEVAPRPALAEARYTPPAPLPYQRRSCI